LNVFSVNGKPTLKTFKYLVLPIWWSDEDSSDSSLTMSPTHIQDIYNQNKQYYDDMSWGKMDVTFQVLPQTVFTISSASPTFDATYDAAKAIVDSLGYVEDEDFNGINLVYFTAKTGVFSGAGGWAEVNGRFMWMSYELALDVTRHEIGHNFGHPHHGE